MDNLKNKLNNGLEVGIDWLSFTIMNDYSVDDVVEILGVPRRLFIDMPNGANGYKCMIKYQGISVLFDGGKNMGIHVDVPGSSIHTLLSAYKETFLLDTPFGHGYNLWDSVLSSFCKSILQIGHFTRIDLAIDDIGSKFFSTDSLDKYLDSGCCVSQWRTKVDTKSSVISTLEKSGHTIYLGSSTSDIRLRVYDKKLEQNGKYSSDSDKYVSYEWVRWELQVRRKEKADVVARYFVENKSIGEVSMGILSHYLRIVDFNADTNKSRCPCIPQWSEFLDSVLCLKLTVKKKEKTLDEEMECFEHQYGRIVSKFVSAKYGDTSFLGDIAVRYSCKLTAQDKIDIEKHQRMECCL